MSTSIDIQVLIMKAEFAASSRRPHVHLVAMVMGAQSISNAQAHALQESSVPLLLVKPERTVVVLARLGQ